MIGFKSRSGRRVKNNIARNIEKLYREGKCRECSVVVTRMDFAKILGKFTKVKIQYEKNATPQTSKPVAQYVNKSKNNENGKVLEKNNSQNSRAAKPVKVYKNLKKNENEDQQSSVMKSPKSVNILKDNNYRKANNSKVISITSKSCSSKQYAIMFVNPTLNGNHEIKLKVTLADLIPNINKDLLPNEDWCIEFFPKNLEPKDDKMYNRIAAELEDLMYSKIETTENTDSKTDDFPSIMDILNDNPSTTNEIKNEVADFKPSVESSDVEAMLLGKSDTEKSEPMEIDKSDVNKLIEEVVQLAPSTEIEEGIKNNVIDNPQSPSILDEVLQQGTEEHLPTLKTDTECTPSKPLEEPSTNLTASKAEKISVEKDPTSSGKVKYEEVIQVIFKKILDGKCDKMVTCLKSLRYNIHLQEKPVEFLGAPKYISSIEDIKVLLQIVNDTTLDNLYVLH